MPPALKSPTRFSGIGGTVLHRRGVPGRCDGDGMNVVPWDLRVGVPLPVPAHPPVHETPVRGERGIRAEAQPLGYSGTEALDDNIERLQRPEQTVPDER